MLAPFPTAQSFTPYPSALRHRPVNTPTAWRPGMNLTIPSLQAEGAGDIELPEDVLGRRKINYDVIMFHGKRGDGKSTLMVAVLKRMKKIYGHLGVRRKIFTNFRVDFADMAHPRLVDELVQFPDWFHDCDVGIDELASNFPSLRANSREQLMWQTMTQQIRKLRVSLLYTTQYPTYVGAASNIQINWYIKPHLLDWHYYKPVRQYVADTIEFDVVDWFGSQTGFPIMHRWPPMPWDAVYRRVLYNVSEVYTEFDTDEVIPPFYAPNREKIMERQEHWKRQMDAEREADERVRVAREEARHTLKDIQDVAATTLEEFYETLKMTLPNKPQRLNDLFDMVKKIDPAYTIKKLREELEAQGWTVATVGQSLHVGKKLEAS